MRANGIMVRRRGAGHTHHGGEEIRTIHREENDGNVLDGAESDSGWVHHVH